MLSRGRRRGPSWRCWQPFAFPYYPGASTTPTDLSDGQPEPPIARQKPARATAQTVETQFRGLLESAPDAIVIADQDGRIAIVNRQTESWFGYPRAELLGQPVELLIPERHRLAHPAHRTRYFEAPRPRPMGAGGLALLARRKDGTEFPAEISLSPLVTHEGVLAITAIRDITDRQRTH